MQKIAIGVLTLLLLFFVAANTRLGNERRRLEAELAVLEGRPRPKSAPKPELAAEPAPSASVAANPVPPPAAAPLDQAQAYITRVLEDTGTLANLVKHQVTLLTRQVADADLGLSEWQKRQIEQLSKNSDLQTQVYRDQIRKIEEQTDLAIRQLLDSNQLKAYNEQKGRVEVVGQVTVQPQPDPAPSGQTPGYLGVTAASADGGGLKITEVLPDSAAGRFGLQANDVVLEFNGQPITNFGGMAEQIRAQGQGAYVTLRIRRGDADFNQGVELGGRPR